MILSEKIKKEILKDDLKFKKESNENFKLPGI